MKNTKAGKEMRGERTSADLEAEFGAVQMDHFHGGDDPPGLPDLPGDDEVQVGLFHQVLHVPLRLHLDRLFHAYETNNKSTTVRLTVMHGVRILLEKKESRPRPLSLGSMVTVGALSRNSALLTPV